MAPIVTEGKFADLKAKLRELFELDKSDLDFGIYRIMAAKNKEVNEFLDRQLKDVVRQTLAAHGAGASAQIEADIEKARSAARTAGFDPEESPTVKALKIKLAVAGGASAAELEADIYNHLLAFFSRYYDEGDFISKRRYKGDVYAIPYGGEEVTLHWANKDQYYIKSGEWHKDYRFKVGGKTVHFKLIEATQETNNNKESDDAKRRYILATDRPVEANDTELTLRFEFRIPTEAEKETIPEATRIFGGKYAAASGRTKGDEREQFCADAEQRALTVIPESWSTIVCALSPTETKPARTILGKHLEDFTARNTFDYFIHKDLGGFLRRELDFYIKNEVVRLDDLEALPADHLARVQGKVKAIRTVAGRIIDFLASIENFQKKMWLKKKLVLTTNWLITVDRIPASLRDTVANNKDQWKEWELLGFKPAEDTAMLLTTPKWGTRAYLDANDKLVVDTKCFVSRDQQFKFDLLASDEVLGQAPSLDSALTGILLHSENFQALRLLRTRFVEQLKYIYIDPPYNTDSAPILYKNGYRDASWLSLVADRAVEAFELLSPKGVKTIAIDDTEMAKLSEMLAEIAPNYRLSRITVVHNPKGSITKDFNRVHEYALFLTNEGVEGCIARTLEKNDVPRKMRRWGENSLRTDRRPSFYPIYVKDGQITRIGDVPPDEFHPTGRNVVCATGETEIWPIDQVDQDDHNKVERRWNFGLDSIRDNLKRIEVHPVEDSLDLFVTHEETVPKTMWSGGEFDAGNYGNTLLIDILGEKRFDFPKSIRLMEKCISLVMTNMETESYVMDYFGGSGTNAHAVINLNRRGEGEGKRRFVLVEMGAYFHTVLKPRITKVLYSPEWKAGKAQVHGNGTSALVKYFALESYEDALNNLPSPTGELLASADPATKDALITYSLDLELGPNLLNLDAFCDPWGYTINAQPAGEAEIRKHPVDLVETFNYLLGMKVRAYGPMEYYSAEFDRAAHGDNLGRIKVKGRLRRDSNGPFLFQRVEGELLDGTRILVVWRKLTADAEQDAATLDAWMLRHREETKERSEYRDYHLIYINGPVTLPQPTAEIRTVLPIEQTFKDRMFAEADEGTP